MSLILASGSPRRRVLLEELGLEPIIRPTDIDETPLPGEQPAPYVQRLALAKGAACTAASGDISPNDIFPNDISPNDIVISADTIVSLDDQLLGKPTDDAHAATMLRQLSGRTHEVFTGVALRTQGETVSFVERTVVHFAELTDDDIAWYVGTGEPADKAGAYAMQGRGGAFVTAIEGSYDNVIGLPRFRLRSALAELR